MKERMAWLDVAKGLCILVGRGFFKKYPFEAGYFREKALRFRGGLSTPLP